MSQPTVCSVCGGELAPGNEFCRFCGSAVEVSAEAVGQDIVEEVDVVSVPSCPQCGAPIKQSGQKFCASCGGVLDPSTAAAAPLAMPPQVVGGTAPVMAAAPAATDSFKEGFAKASSKLDSFMGSTVDLESVGKDFDPNSIVLDNISSEELRNAFAFFGKSFEVQPSEADSVSMDVESSRSESENKRAKEARSKESRDFSAKAGTMVFGALSSQLHSEFAPKVDMVAEQREKAANKEKKDRLKHKVALGEMDKRSAVDQAKE